MTQGASVQGESLALLTDLYELTMAYAFWHSGMADREAVFHLSFREAPFGNGFTVACGLEALIQELANFYFTSSDLDYLASVPGRDGKPLFPASFLDRLRNFRFLCDVDAIPEGTVVFPYEPMVRVQGPIWQAQILETLLLTLINFQSLIATKAARVCLAAQGDPVVEFGLRRAQGIDGGMSASRSAYVGGCSGTSNMLAGKKFGIPVVGTHAHSWVMSFDSELAAFKAYADAMPTNSILLVDTYDSLEGVRHAVQVGKSLREKGYDLAGIRLDSGDLAYLSIEARKILDEAGFPKAVIVGSNDLDERIIASLKQQGAAINDWGVGTRLVTAFGQPALGGVYKLAAIRQAGGKWEYKVKASEQVAKSTIPGILQVRRFQNQKGFVADAIYDVESGLPSDPTIIHPVDVTRRKHVNPGLSSHELLVPIFRRGQLVYQSPTLAQVRERVKTQLSMLHPGIKRAVNPHQYPAGLESSLHALRTDMLLKCRNQWKHEES